MVGSYLPSRNSTVLTQSQDKGQNVYSASGAGAVSWVGPQLYLGRGHLLVQLGPATSGK